MKDSGWADMHAGMQARAAVEGLFSSKSGKQLLPAKSSSSFVSVKSGKQLLSRKSSSSVVESVDEPDQVGYSSSLST